MRTKPLAPVIVSRDRAIAPSPAGRPSFEVYGADDTFVGDHPPIELPFDDETRQYRIGLGVFGAAVVLITSLAVIGSCDDKPTPGSTETTAATMTPQPSPQPFASAMPSAAESAPEPTGEPPPNAPPLRSPTPRRKKRH